MHTAAVCYEEPKPSPIVIPFGVGHHSFTARGGVRRHQRADGVAGKVKQKVCTAFLSWRPHLLRTGYGRLKVVSQVSLNICFVHAPAAPDGLLPAVEYRFKLRGVLQDQLMDGRMIHWDLSLLHHLLKLRVTQWLCHVPSYARQEDVLLEVDPFEANHPLPLRVRHG